MMKTFPFTPAALRGRLFDPDDPLCPFHHVPARRPAVDAALRLLAPAFDAVVDIGLAAGRWHEPVWACSRRCGVRLLLVSRCRRRRVAFARACGALVSIDWTDDRGAVPPLHPRWKLPWVAINPVRVGIGGAASRLRAAMRMKNIPLVPYRDGCGRAFCVLPPLCVYLNDVGRRGGPLETWWGSRLMGCGRVDLRAVALFAGAEHPGRIGPPALLPSWEFLNLDGDDMTGTAAVRRGGTP